MFMRQIVALCLVVVLATLAVESGKFNDVQSDQFKPAAAFNELQLIRKLT